MIRPIIRHGKLLFGANIALAVFLLVGAVAAMLRKGGQESSELFVRQADSTARLLESELLRVRQEARTAADLTTHIFSNPESYRLAAQPGEYDYDQTTGIYGSSRNDASVVFLSSVSRLNPDILREIRLSEYLNPVFKASVGRNPLARSITLYTTDGLVRSYPWFDFKNRIATGGLRPNFLVTELPFFAKAMPGRNHSKGDIWEALGGKGRDTQLVCAAPFLAGDTFRGVVAIEVDTERLSALLFEQLEHHEMLGFLMAGGDRVLGTSRKSDSKVGFKGHLPTVLSDLRVSGLGGVEPLMRRTANSEKFFGGDAGFQVVAAGALSLPVKAVLVVPEAKAGQHRPTGFPFWLLIGAVLGCGLLLVDTWWIVQTRRSLAESEKQLSHSFTALSDLNLQSALIAGSQSIFSDPIEGELASQRALEASPPLPAPEAGGSQEGPDPKQLGYQTAAFCAFDAGDSVEGNLKRLAEVLRAAFEVRLVTFLLYSESALKIFTTGRGISAAEAELEWRQGPLFDALSGSQSVVSSNTLALSVEDGRMLSRLIQGSYLAMPLIDDQRLVGAVVLSEKALGISDEDEAFLGALQPVLSRTIQNIHQCDRLAKLNQLRREYCVELAKAIGTPLDRIRTEVLSIYARLGKLTPYYKHHCETILFEVGKLYEMLLEASEIETAVESKSLEKTASPETALAAAEKKDHP